MSTQAFPAVYLIVTFPQPASSFQAKMDQILKKFYIAFLFETLLLTIILLWNPSEAGSQFILGRSLFRWILSFPAILILLAGSTIFFVKPWREQLISIHTINKLVAAWTGRTGEYLILTGVAVLFFILAFLWGANKTGHQDVLIRVVPWLIFAVFLFIQFSYLLIKIEEDHGNPVDFRKSFTRIPLALKYLLLDEKEDKPSISENVSNILYGVAIAALIFVFLFQGYFFLKFAGLNSDEGWYLYAARQVFHGERPYQDFAFTQMPLLPYIYGIGQLIYPSMYTGRVTSLIIFGLGLYFATSISRNFFKREASIWFLLVAVTYASSFYFNVIVKTYPLTFFFMVLSIHVWLSELKAEIKYPLLTAILLLGFFTRITFLAYAVVLASVMLIDVWKSTNRSKLFLTIFAVNTPLLLWGISFFYPNPGLPVWNIFTYNAGIHGLGGSTKIVEEFFSHFRDFLDSVQIFWLLGIPLSLSLFSGFYYRTLNSRRNRQTFIALIATFTFISSHFIGSAPMGEYYVSPIMVLVILIVCFLFSASAPNSGLNQLTVWTSRLALAYAVIMLVTTEKFGQYNYDYYKGHPPIQTIRELAKVVNQYYPDAPLFTLEGLYVTIDAKREVLPDLSMAQFSILNMDAEEVTKFHFVNPPLVAGMLLSPDTKIVILTEKEIVSLQTSIDGFNTIMEEGYHEVYRTDYFGQKSVKAYVFVRK